MDIRFFHKVIAPVSRRVRLMIGRGLIKLVYDDLKAQGLQVSLLSGELRDKVERFQEYGFTSHPHPDAEVIVVSVSGNRDHVVVIACDDRRYRLKGLQEGEVALYTDEEDYIKLGRGNIVEIKTKTLKLIAETKVEITSPTVTASGNVSVDGNISADGNVSDGTRSMAGDRGIYNSHTHPEHDGGSTSAPAQSM